MKQLYYNGNIFTMARDHYNEQVEYIVVNNGVIEYTGNDFSIYNDIENIERIDLKGKTLIPSFTDSHIHLIGLGETLRRVNISSIQSQEKLKGIIHNESTTFHHDGQWLIIEGYIDEFHQSMINHEQLSEWTCGPTLLVKASKHSALLNEQAINTLKNLQQDQLLNNVDENGFIYDENYFELYQYVIEQSSTNLTELINDAIDECVSKGISCVHTEDLSYYGHYMNPLNAYFDVINQGTKFRLNLLVNHNVYKEVEHVEKAIHDDWLRFDAIKIFIDGTFGDQSAYLIEPYIGTSNYGRLIHDKNTLEQMVKDIRKHHKTCAFHVIGDKALDIVLTILEENLPKEGHFDRLIHVSLVNDNLLQRIKKLPLICDIQPLFHKENEKLIKILGFDRIDDTHAYHKIKDYNIQYASSSDAPIGSVDVLNTIEYLCGKLKWNRFEAIQTYTVNSSVVGQRAGSLGKILPGFKADFVILSSNIFDESIPIEDIEVIQTIIDGETVYSRK